MNKQMKLFLDDLADVLEKHGAGLTYTSRDDGIYAYLGDCYKNKICIGFPCNGQSDIREILNYTPDEE